MNKFFLDTIVNLLLALSVFFFLSCKTKRDISFSKKYFVIFGDSLPYIVNNTSPQSIDNIINALNQKKNVFFFKPCDGCATEAYMFKLGVVLSVDSVEERAFPSGFRVCFQKFHTGYENYKMESFKQEIYIGKAKINKHTKYEELIKELSERSFVFSEYTNKENSTKGVDISYFGRGYTVEFKLDNTTNTYLINNLNTKLDYNGE